MRLRHLLPAAAAALAALPAPALAADPWSPPEPVRYGSTSPTLQGAPALTANASGLAVAVADSGGGNGDAGPHTMASPYTNGVFLTRTPLTPRNYAFGPGNGGVAAYGSTRLIGAGIHYGKYQRVDDAFGRLTPNRAALGRMRSLGPARMHAHGAALAVDDAGDAAIVYPVCRDAGCRRVLVYLAMRRAGGSSFTSTRLYDGEGPLPRVAVAVNARGDAVAVWSAAGRLYARIRTAGGGLRARQDVGATSREMVVTPSVALSLHRGELVGWVAQGVSEGDGSAGSARAARARDGGAFTVTPLSALPAGTGRYVSEAGVRVAYDPAGRSLVAFTAFGARFEVRTGELAGAANAPHQSLAHVQTVSDPAQDTVLGDLVTGPAGGELAVLLTGVAGHDPAPGATGQGVEAALLPAGPAGPVTRESVAAVKPSPLSPSGLDAARLANGRVLAAWTTPSQDDLFAQRAPASLP